jgi:hypothetical protein
MRRKESTTLERKRVVFFKKELERKVEERRNKFMVLIYWEVVRNFLA